MISNSFRFPLDTYTTFLQPSIYDTATVGTGTFIHFADPFTAGFNTTKGYPLPQLGLTFTNRFQMEMVDDATGRVIDYVALDGMTGQRQLTGAGEMQGNDGWGHGGVWDTNRIPTGSGSLNNSFWGIENQVSASLQNPPYNSPNGNDFTQLTVPDWQNAATESEGFQSVNAAVTAFQNFYQNGQASPNGSLTMQVPYTPTRTVCVYYTWQANDPLVHYTTPDLTDRISSTNSYQTNWVFDDIIQSNLGSLNKRYMPWGGALLGGDPGYDKNVAILDPLMTGSDAWQFPNTNFPNIGWLGRIHRGTPWQTVYMKSLPIDSTTWQNWTGNTTIFPSIRGIFGTPDSTISQPSSDWAIFDLFTTAPNDNATRGQLSINQTNYAAWAALLDGVLVVTNDPVNGLTPLVIDPNIVLSNINDTAPHYISQGIAAQRSQNGNGSGVFTRLGDILATPALTAASPFIDTNDPKQELNDEAYERVAAANHVAAARRPAALCDLRVWAVLETGAAFHRSGRAILRHLHELPDYRGSRDADGGAVRADLPAQPGGSLYQHESDPEPGDAVRIWNPQPEEFPSPVSTAATDARGD